MSAGLQPTTGVIGGTGLETWPELTLLEQVVIDTPYGAPTAPLIFGTLAGKPVCFLSRHGADHQFAPHAINYRANVWALREVGVHEVIGVAAVGGIRADLQPGTVVIPDQIIDYSWGRDHSFYLHAQDGVEHIEFEAPYNELLRQRLLDAGRQAGVEAIAGGTYACTQGPRLETAAEIRRLQRDGADMVGMTGMPETALAREAGLDYACVAVSVNWAAGLGPEGEGVHAQMELALKSGMDRALRLIAALLAQP